MPIPVKSSCSTRSMDMLSGRNEPAWFADRIGPNSTGDGNRRRVRAGTTSNCLDRRESGPSWSEGPFARSVVEFDVLVENDVALVVFDDVVAVQAVAVLVEIVFALGARELFDGQDGLADLRRIGRAGLVDRGRKHVHGVIGPGTLVVRRDLDEVAI